ncbi:PAS domain-containing sensor histidine kinase [Paucihalobacter sp.]|uniref:PAS domain-containing sensor histidine kinase n=1 Tax=Paucihalobacter sp. TaxID=2850405 RepID=UPI002FE2850E
MRLSNPKIGAIDTNHIRVLLLQNPNDDNIAIMEQLELLTDFSFQLEVAMHEVDYKSLLKNFKPNLIISKLNLVHFCGKKALTLCKVFFTEIPFIFISDDYCYDTSLDLLKQGTDDLIQKKNLHELPASIYKALRHSQEKNLIKQVKQKRWEDSQRYKGLIEHSHEPVIAYNEAGIISYVSPAIKNVLGYTQEEFIGTQVESYIHPDDLIMRTKKLNNLIDKNDNYFVIKEERLKHKNGHYIWGEAIISDARLSPGIGGFVTNFRDITEAKLNRTKLEKTLKELTDYRVALVESSIVAITDTEGFITYVNKEFCRVSQFSEDELIGVNLIDNGENDEEIALYSEIKSKISSGEIWKGEIQRTAKDGTRFWVNGTVIPFADTNAEIYQYIIVMQNITERKRKTQELKTSLDLVYAQNDQLLNFSYIVSHNLRSHASNLSTIIDHLSDCESEDQRIEMTGYLKEVSNSLNDALQNLNEVVSIQSNKTIKTEKLVLLEYVQKSLKGLNKLVLHGQIEINIPANLEINFNKGYLESVLQNLIQNSLKYKHPDRDPKIEISAVKHLDGAILKIRDNGLGIDLIKNKDKIFGMYKTFHGNKNALGLGLFMTKNQIEAMGGSISIESEVNVGTTFTILIK